MFRIAALNDSSDSEDSSPQTDLRGKTKEAKEEEAYKLYNAALTHQRHGNVTKAEEAFKKLLENAFIKEAIQLVEDDVEGAVHPALQLLYSIYKNLATMALQRKEYREAAEFYIEAIKIDTSETSVWYKLGTIALKLFNFPLARLGFEQGLQCNPNHWPCLDHLVSLLYTMNDYWNCLYYISKALEKDFEYTKGLVLFRQILKEQPSLASDANEMFSNCDVAIYNIDVDEEESREIIQECINMQNKRRELAKSSDPKYVQLPRTLATFTWKSLGECLIELYNMVKSADPPQSMGLRVDLSNYDETNSQSAVVDKTENIEENMETDSPLIASASCSNQDLATNFKVDGSLKDKGKTESSLNINKSGALDETSIKLDFHASEETRAKSSGSYNQGNNSTTKIINSEEILENEDDIIKNIVDDIISEVISKEQNKNEIDFINSEKAKNTDVEMKDSEIASVPEMDVAMKEDNPDQANDSQGNIPLIVDLCNEIDMKPSKAPASEAISEEIPVEKMSVDVESVSSVSPTLNILPQNEAAMNEQETKKSTEKLNDGTEKSISDSTLTYCKNLEVNVQETPAVSSTMTRTSPVVSAATALHDHTCSAPAEAEELARNKAKAQKRKKPNTSWMDELGVKRRSARVRNTTKQKEEETVNFYELLIAFLPSTLRRESEDDDLDSASMNADSDLSQSQPADTSKLQQLKLLTEREEADVKAFLQKNQKNGGLLSLILDYLITLSKLEDYKWTFGLTSLYLQLFGRLRRHMELPDVFCSEFDPENVRNMARVTLLAVEFQVDHWLITSSQVYPGSSPKSHGHGTNCLQASEMPEHCEDDLGFITGLTICEEVLETSFLLHCIRTYWVKARLYLLQGKMEDGLYCFHKTLEHLEVAKSQNNDDIFQLSNCRMDNIISIDLVKKNQESLQRCQSLEEIQHSYESGNYEKVVEFLLQTFNMPQQKQKMISSSQGIPERQSQLLLLQESLYKMNDHKRGAIWSEVVFNECVQCYKKGKSAESREEWSSTLAQVCQNFLMVLEKDETAMKEIPIMSRVRLARNLVNIIDHTMAVPEGSTEKMPVGTLLPWILMYRLIKSEEESLRAKQLTNNDIDSKADPFSAGIPSYLMLLNVAHDYLGRHSWCTKTGEFLKFYMKVAQHYMPLTSDYRRDLENAFEQCVYCLYGHPNKKGRAKHLQDHNAHQIDLDWDTAVDLFEYFKPKSVPEFDSYKQDTISADVEFLMRRIVNLVPDEERPTKYIEELQNYIYGVSNEEPSLETQKACSVSKEIYYLLADYYFKNKEQAKAIKFYMYDICMNPERLDSWAGMALARMSQLEQKLNSTELRMDMPVHKKSIGALRCFKKAVDIEEFNCKLWMEYGSLAYQLQSHASRQLKWQKLFPLSEEMKEIAKDSRQEMLQIAFNCYNKAYECESEETEEEWLQHYMIGKCLEKMRKPPGEYLLHYQKAAINLYDDGATYPKKIIYAYTTPHLAAEALEMFYRLHVSILKNLLKEDKIMKSHADMFDKYMNEAAQSPFATCSEKRAEKRSVSEVSAAGEPAPKRTKISTNQDHTYSRQKSLTDTSDQEVFLDTSSVDIGLSMKEDGDNKMRENISNPKSNEENGQSQSSTNDVQMMKASGTLDLENTNESKKVTIELSADTLEIQKTSEESVSETNSEKTPLKKQETTGFEVQEIVKETQVKETQESKPRISSSDCMQEDGIDFLVSETSATNIPVFDSSNTIKNQTPLEEGKAKQESSRNPIEIIEIASSASEILSSADESEVYESVIKLQNDESKSQTAHATTTPSVVSKDDKDDKESLSADSSQDYSNNVETFTAQVTNMVNVDFESIDGNVLDKDSSLPSTKAGSDLEEMENSIDEEITSASEMSGAVKDVGLFTPSDLSRWTEAEDSNRLQPESAKVTPHATDLDSLDASSLTSSSEFDEDSIPSSVDSMLLSQKSQKTDNLSNSGAYLAQFTQFLNQKSNSPLTVGKEEKDSHVERLPEENTSEKKIGEASITNKTEDEKESGIHSDSQLGKVADTSHVLQTEKENKSSSLPEACEDDVKMDVDKPLSPKAGQPDSLTVKTNTNRDGDEKVANESKQTAELNDALSTIASPGKTIEKRGVDIFGKEVVEHSDETWQYKGSKKPSTEPTGKNLNESVIQNETEGQVKDSSLQERSTCKPDSQEEIITTKDIETKGTLPKTEVAVTTEVESTLKEEKPIENDVPATAQKHKELIEKCMAALHLCLSRFPTHFKSLYRLACVFTYSPFHKNLKFAHDILMGKTDLQKMEQLPAHMPVQGLFAERKQNNFFQGIWRVPIEEIDRSGSFASHLNRSVALMLHVLKELKDVAKLHHVHIQLNKTPDSGKKYLRDAERASFAKQAHQLCLGAIKARVSDLKKSTDREHGIKCLMDVYRVWNYIQYKMHITATIEANELLENTFRAIMKSEVIEDGDVLEQAIKFCQQQIQNKSKSNQASGSISQSDSSMSQTPEKAVSKPVTTSSAVNSPGVAISATSTPVQSTKKPLSSLTKDSKMGSPICSTDAVTQQKKDENVLMSSVPFAKNKPASPEPRQIATSKLGGSKNVQKVEHLGNIKSALPPDEDSLNKVSRAKIEGKQNLPTQPVNKLVINTAMNKSIKQTFEKAAAKLFTDAMIAKKYPQSSLLEKELLKPATPTRNPSGSLSVMQLPEGTTQKQLQVEKKDPQCLQSSKSFSSSAAQILIKDSDIIEISSSDNEDEPPPVQSKLGHAYPSTMSISKPSSTSLSHKPTVSSHRLISEDKVQPEVETFSAEIATIGKDECKDKSYEPASDEASSSDADEEFLPPKKRKRRASSKGSNYASPKTNAGKPIPVGPSLAQWNKNMPASQVAWPQTMGQQHFLSRQVPKITGNPGRSPLGAQPQRTYREPPASVVKSNSEVDNLPEAEKLFLNIDVTDLF